MNWTQGVQQTINCVVQQRNPRTREGSLRVAEHSESAMHGCSAAVAAVSPTVPALPGTPPTLPRTRYAPEVHHGLAGCSSVFWILFALAARETDKLAAMRAAAVRTAFVVPSPHLAVASFCLVVLLRRRLPCCSTGQPPALRQRRSAEHHRCEQAKMTNVLASAGAAAFAALPSRSDSGRHCGQGVEDLHESSRRMAREFRSPRPRSRGCAAMLGGVSGCRKYGADVARRV